MANSLSEAKEQIACREKHWSEITQKEKIERMRKMVKKLIQDVDSLNNQMRKVRTHSHSPEGKAVIIEDLLYYNRGEGRIFHDEGDNVYF